MEGFHSTAALGTLPLALPPTLCLFVASTHNRLRSCEYPRPSGGRHLLSVLAEGRDGIYVGGCHPQWRHVSRLGGISKRRPAVLLNARLLSSMGRGQRGVEWER